MVSGRKRGIRLAWRREKSTDVPESGSETGGAQLSDDQAAALTEIRQRLEESGIRFDRTRQKKQRRKSGATELVAVLGMAGSGKTFFLSELVRQLVAAGVRVISDEPDGKGCGKSRTLAILSPTNKAASVLRNRDVPATTIHRIMYRPHYHPEYEMLTDWLAGHGKRPTSDRLPEAILDRVAAFFGARQSLPAALAAAGIKTSDFISGWTRREDPLDIGFVDEASMLSNEQLEDLKEIFSTIILFGDPAQLAPVGQSAGMVFDDGDSFRRLHLHRIHRQSEDNPILDLAHALLDEDLDFAGFVGMLRRASERDDRVRFSGRVESTLMARSPVLCWRNSSRVRLVHAFRRAYDAPDDALLPGEPLICDGLELPREQRDRRIDFETQGLIKGAQAVFLGRGQRQGYSRLHLIGSADQPVVHPTIIKIEVPGEDEPFIASAARMGAVFLHGAACTIHKAQGSQWESVQIFGPDLLAASKSGLTEAGMPLWKRLAYVAVTRAESRLIWVHKASLALPREPLDTSDLEVQQRFDLASDEAGGNAGVG